MSRSEAPTARLPVDGADGPLVLERYRLHARLGAGAFGVVWRGRDERLERDVAVKAIPRDRMAGRAEREARTAARLAHPAIVTLYEAGADDDTMYLVSELVRGGTLAELLAEGALSDRDVAEIGIALCQALAHAHAQGVVHRDVKPSNVLVPDAPAGIDGPAAKLTDFGVARVVAGEGADLLTATGDVVGTLAYMAPEQAEGREAGPPADLYAAALVLYEALSGVNPIRGGSAAATARRLGARLPPLRRQRADLPPALGDAIDRALLPRPGDRGTVADLHRALKAALRELGDEPGTIATPALDRVATAVTQVVAVPRRLGRGWGRRARERELAEVAAELGAGDEYVGADRRGMRRSGATARGAEGVWEDDALDDGQGRRIAWDGRPVRRQSPVVSGHVAPGAAAGALVVLALATLPGPAAPATPSPLLAGALAAAVVGLLPRLGFVATATVLLGWLASEGDAAGSALVLACALGPIVLLLPRAGHAWSLPFAAPLLGVAMLAGAYPALAGQARTLWRRAALGALGFWLLALAEPLAHATLLYGPAAGSPRGDAWQRSLDAAATDVIVPLVQSGALACAALWALGAAILPWLVRGRSAALDLIAATMWAAGLAAGAGAIGRSLDGVVPSPDPRGAALGAAAAVLLAVAMRTARLSIVSRRREHPAGDPLSPTRALP